MAWNAGPPLLGILFVLGAAPAAAQQRRAITVEDFLSLKTVSDPRPSPDGSLVAYTVGTISLGDNRSVSRLHLVEVASGRSRELATGEGSARAARWAADGKTLAFISTADGGPQIWRMSVDSGRPTKVTSVPGGIGDFISAPDGRSFYFTRDVKWPAVQELDQRHGEFPTEARLWTDLFYRHWDEWRVGIRQHLFRVELADGKVTDLTPLDRDVPTIALGGNDLALSLPGTELAMVYNPDSGVATSTNNDIFVAGPDGSGRQSITTNPANDHSPTYSPDSRYIGYLAMSVPGFESDRQQIWLYVRATGRRIAITPDWNLSVAAITWTNDSRALIAEVEERGEHVFYRVEVPSGARTRILTGGLNSSLAIPRRADPGILVFLRQTAIKPAEVFISDLDGGGLRQLTRVNDEALSRLQLNPLEPFSYIGALGDSIHGWLMKPPGFNSQLRYPVVYLVHGGPQGAWLDNWHARWNYALFAARGYVVAAVNFHGSTGYGQSFTNSISRHWGDYPYEDLMKGVDHLATLPYVDTTRIGAAGASYGGYMVFWMAGHTNRFRTLVAHDGIFNTVSMAGTTEELWFPLREFGGTQLSQSARATMEKWSPHNYVANWVTPMLIVHGQQDFRVDVSEGFQAFTALRLRGVPGKFLYFPDEGHWVLRPRNRRLWWNTVLDWMDQHLREPSVGR
jgi:dipeptidyl aminopeptidase/acylaminoacyl peptidase